MRGFSLSAARNQAKRLPERGALAMTRRQLALSYTDVDINYLEGI
jgi:hypothetical protein